MEKPHIRKVAIFLVLATILLLSVVCFRQNRKIVFYEGYFDNTIPVYIEKIDSLNVEMDTVKDMVLRLTYQELFITNIQHNLTKKEQLLITDPKSYLNELLKKETNLGGE